MTVDGTDGQCDPHVLYEVTIWSEILSSEKDFALVPVGQMGGASAVPAAAAWTCGCAVPCGSITPILSAGQK